MWKFRKRLCQLCYHTITRFLNCCRSYKCGLSFFDVFIWPTFCTQGWRWNEINLEYDRDNNRCPVFQINVNEKNTLYIIAAIQFRAWFIIELLCWSHTARIGFIGRRSASIFFTVKQQLQWSWKRICVLYCKWR